MVCQAPYEPLAEAVKLILDEGYTIAESARALGVPEKLVGRWKTETSEPEHWFRKRRIKAITQGKQAIAHGKGDFKKNGWSVLPNSRLGIDVVGSQSGEFDVATLLIELKLILEQYGLTGDQLNNSSINLASNDVPRIAATLSLLTTQFDESYIGNLHFDVDGKLIVPVFGLNDLEPAVFST